MLTNNQQNRMIVSVNYQVKLMTGVSVLNFMILGCDVTFL
jgi:hypothetical protein